MRRDRSSALTRARDSQLRPVDEGESRGGAPWRGDAETDWQRYVGAVQRHRWVVLAVVIVGTLAGAIGARFLHEPYTADAMLLVEDGGQGTPAGADHALVAAVDGPELVQSNAVFDDVVRDLRLYLHPRTPADSAALVDFSVTDHPRPGAYRVMAEPGGRYMLLAGRDSVVERGAIGDSIGRSLGFAWRPSRDALPRGRTIAFRVDAPWDAMQRVAKALTVHGDPGAHLLRLSFKDRDPARAAGVLNAIAHGAVAMAADLDARRVKSLAELLRAQYAHARATLAAAEDSLKTFQTRTADQLPAQAPPVAPDMNGRADPAYANAFDLRLRLDQLRRDRQAIAAVLAGPHTAAAEVDALSALPVVQQSAPLKGALDSITEKQANIRALEAHYTKESAPVRQARDELDALTGQSVPTLAGGLVDALDARIAELRPRVDSAVGYFHRIPTLTLAQARLTRAVDNATSLANDLRDRYDRARVALASDLPSLSVVDSAVVPDRPEFDLGPLLIAVAFFTSVGVGVGGVTLFERLDPKVRRPEQIVDAMQLPILGALPRWRPPRGMSEPDPEMIESLRSLRMRLLGAGDVGSPRLITVTSPSSGDGKSFMSVNLALSFAYAGFKTLLVDGDVRGGKQHRVLNVPRRPGLIDVLAGDVALERALHATEHHGLAVLASGRRTPRAPELLLSPRLRDVVGRLRRDYEVVIIDSAPLSAGVDPIALAEVSGDLLLVMRSGATDFPLAVSKLDALDHAAIRVLGVVLNDVRARDDFRYYTYDLSAYPQAHDASDAADRPLGILGANTS